MIDMEVNEVTPVRHESDTQDMKWVRVTVTDSMRVPANMSDNEIADKFIVDLYQDGGWPATTVENYSEKEALQAEEVRTEVVTERSDLISPKKVHIDKMQSAMTRLKSVLGTEDFNLVYSLLKLVDNEFQNIVFPNEWKADNIEGAHDAVRNLSLMMETVE